MTLETGLLRLLVSPGVLCSPCALWRRCREASSTSADGPARLPEASRQVSRAVRFRVAPPRGRGSRFARHVGARAGRAGGRDERRNKQDPVFSEWLCSAAARGCASPHLVRARGAPCVRHACACGAAQRCCGARACPAPAAALYGARPESPFFAAAARAGRSRARARCRRWRTWRSPRAPPPWARAASRTTAVALKKSLPCAATRWAPTSWRRW
jgi:hypothetical protein